MTVRPMRPAPSSTWLPRRLSVSELICWFISDRPDTELNCASWPTYCAGSMGLKGSWFRSCVIMSVRKSSWLSSVFFALASLAARRAASACGSEFGRTRAALMVSMSSMLILLSYPISTCPSTLAQPQRGQQHVLRGVHHLDIVLVRTRRRDHVDHFFDHVDRGRVHVALGIGERVARLVTSRGRRLRFIDTGDAHRGVAALALLCGAGLELRTHGFENRVARLVDTIRIAAHALGVGEIAGGGVQAHRLRRHARTRDIKGLEGRH